MAGIFPECETCFDLVLSSTLITKMVVDGSKFHKVMQQRTLFPLEPELCYCETSVFHRRVNKSSRQPHCPPLLEEHKDLIKQITGVSVP